jgi:hypothetical protein
MYKTLGVAAALIAFALIVLRFGAHAGVTKIVPVGQAVRQDDFLYTVTHVVEKKTASSTVYVVTIRVDNQALRVDYHWSDDIAYVADGAGRKFQARANSAAAGETKEEWTVPPGGSADYTLDFELPKDARAPVLRYWNGILMGDIFDGAEYAHVAIPLDSR